MLEKHPFTWFFLKVDENKIGQAGCCLLTQTEWSGLQFLELGAFVEN